MFSNESDNYNMLLGAYKKLKSYYHYNKNLLFMREKIALFEFDSNTMDLKLKHLAEVLKKPSDYSQEIVEWVSLVDFYILPKTFTEDKSLEERFVTSSLPNKSVTRVNFFINMPIELHLFETLWTMFVAKIAHDKDIIKDCSYGNTIDAGALFDKNVDDLKESIRFQKNRLFKIYFPQYCNWKNNAIEAIESNKKDKNTVLVSLDIKSFFYSIHWKFDKLYNTIQDDRLKELSGLTQIMKLIYEKYTAKINSVRVLPQKLGSKENVLPIGLFSSMLIANIYMSNFDSQICNNTNVIYYGRYVDDILLLLNVSQTGFSADDAGVKKLLVSDNGILERNMNMDDYCLKGYDNLIIQRKKLKTIFFECGKCDNLIRQIRKTKIVPSQMNVVPQNDIQMTDFEEAAYAIHNFTTETKIRDLGQLEIDRFKLSTHMAELVRASRYKTSHMATVEEKIQRQKEKDKIIKFFRGSNTIEFSSNWINALYFVMLSSGTNKKDWNNLEESIRTAIKKITINHLEDIRKGKSVWVKSKIKKDMNHLFDVCIATALAINPKFSKKERKEILELCYKIRNANLFNHYLVTFSLMNYSDKIGNDTDFSNMTLSELKKEYFDIDKGRKMELSPRFINFDELFQYYFLRSIVYETGGIVTDTVIKNIRDTFFKVNNINMYWAKPLSINIQTEKEQIEGYKFQRVFIHNEDRDLKKIRIAVANIRLDIEACCMGLNDTPVIRNRFEFLSFLATAYDNGNDKVDYLVFPEFYLPISWMQDVLTFSRKTGITVISGIQYVCKNGIAHNVVGVFARIVSGRYNSSCVLVREKNNYAPLEKKILATEGYRVKDREKPIYICFQEGPLYFGLFLCYEFTDICARGLFKGKADVIFIPENNSDTTYFSNIIETMARDIHAFMVQANTSIYGDSRISGPYSRDQRNIVQIKGGDNDSIIIGTIDVQGVIDDRVKKSVEMEEYIQNTIIMNKADRRKKKEGLIREHDLKIEKVSAGTFGN